MLREKCRAGSPPGRTAPHMAISGVGGRGPGRPRAESGTEPLCLSRSDAPFPPQGRVAPESVRHGCALVEVG